MNENEFGFTGWQQVKTIWQVQIRK